MVAAMAEQREEPARRPGAEDQDVTRVYPVSQEPSADPETRLYPRPAGQLASAEPQARPLVTSLPAWRRYRVRVAAVGAAAAAIIIAVIIVPLSIGGGGIIPAQAAVVTLHVTTAAKVSGYGAATGRATARQDASGSWDITLTVAHLKSFGDRQRYQCWYVSRDHQQVALPGARQRERNLLHDKRGRPA